MSLLLLPFLLGCPTQEEPLPTQPMPENVRVYVEHITPVDQNQWTHRFIRWVDCETRAVCYASHDGFDCLSERYLAEGWVENECRNK
jgi:hypothetical protein